MLVAKKYIHYVLPKLEWNPLQGLIWIYLRLSLKDFFLFLMEQIVDFHDCKGLYEKIDQTLFITNEKIPVELACSLISFLTF